LEKICTWAGPRGLFAQPDLKSLVVYHDDPKIASEDKLRMSICLTAPEDIKTDGEIGKMEIAGGTTLLPISKLMLLNLSKPGTGSIQNGSHPAAISQTKINASSSTQKHQKTDDSR